MFTISPYKLNMYLECPRHYWWNYINPTTRSKQPVRGYFTTGEHVHNALKNFMNIIPEKRSKQMLLGMLEYEWQRKNGETAGFRTSEEELEYKERAQRMLSAFFDREDMTVVPFWASDKLISTGVSETLSFMGKIDRVDEEPDGLHVIDYKSGKEEREDRWQLPMYAVMAKRYFNKPVARLSYLFLETGTWLSVPANPAREAWTIAQIEEIVAAMPHAQDRNTWQCPDGEACTHCNYLREFGINPLGSVSLLSV